MGSLPRREPRLRQSPPCLETASVRKGRRGIVVGDSLLWGTEGSICRPDPTCREVCCLPGAWVRDTSKNLSGLICPSDYYPLLIVQASNSKVTERSLRIIKKDFRGLQQLMDRTEQSYTLYFPLFLQWHGRMLRGAGLTSLSNQYTASEGQRNSRAFEKYVRYVGRNLRTFANLSLDHFLGGHVVATLFSQHV